MQPAVSSELWVEGPVLGQTLGRYELLLPVAKGGMAQVWAARLKGTRGFRKLVAIKTILSGAIDDTQLEQMFLQEATLASQIQHPNVAATLELGEENGLLYLVMEWVDGESVQCILSRAAAHGGVPLAVGVNLIGQACKGLHAAHETRDEGGALLGIVHRDVSPQNILVDYSGTVRLVDFGIAKATARAPNVTEAHQLKGKLSYMAPEQIRRQPLDRRTDIFALGTVLYYLVTGRHAFRGDNPAETLHRICFDDRLTPPSQLEPSCPKRLEDVILKALAKRPAERWSTAHEMLSALEGALPQALEGSFEARVAEYLGDLLAERREQRRAALRSAKERLGGVEQDESSHPSDPGEAFKGALARASADPPIEMSSSGSQPTRGAASEAQRVTESAMEVAARPRILPQFFVAAGFLVATLVIGALVLRVGRDAPDRGATPPRAATPPTAPARGSEVAVGSEPALARVEASAAMAPAVPVASSALVRVISPAQVSAVRNRAARATPGAVQGAPVTVPERVEHGKRDGMTATDSKPPPPAGSAERAASATQPVGAAKPRIDAWDADTFGGRR
jgi:serine/threonine-protein kinase